MKHCFDLHVLIQTCFTDKKVQTAKMCSFFILLAEKQVILLCISNMGQTKQMINKTDYHSDEDDKNKSNSWSAKHKT